jgi:hypothetical protein
MYDPARSKTTPRHCIKKKKKIFSHISRKSAITGNEITYLIHEYQQKMIVTIFFEVFKIIKSAAMRLVNDSFVTLSPSKRPTTDISNYVPL